MGAATAGTEPRTDAAVVDALADLLEYPTEGHADRTPRLAAVVAAAEPGAAADLAAFAGLASMQGLGDCEELYVRTFDVQAERALEVGWQVFGEQYARGAFLADLRRRMRDAGVAETTELPDHLTQVLRLLGRLPAADARTLVDGAVAPSLRRVLAALEPDNPYAGVLTAVGRVLAIDLAAPAAAGAAPGGDARHG